MGVYIKDMEMPQNCQSCNFYNGLGCKATGRMFPMFYNVAVRRSDCPLTEVPEPHGRLIDADKLCIKSYWYNAPDGGKAHFNCVPLSSVKYATTIIPAEEGE